jgi:V8-like Glu-specific endopeptidase
MFYVLTYTITLALYASAATVNSRNDGSVYTRAECSNKPTVKVGLISANDLASEVKGSMPEMVNGVVNSMHFIPKNAKMALKPEFKLHKDKYFNELIKFAPNNTALFSQKRLINEQQYPWCTIGKTFCYFPGFVDRCSGTMVGRNLMLTASHCIPWDRGSDWSMEFIPAYNGKNPNPTPFGSAWVTQCMGIPNTDDVTGRDYVICALDRNIGDAVGYMGYRASTKDDMYYARTWTSVGYPRVYEEGLVPALEENVSIVDIDGEGSDGKELESHVYGSKGWSGGPLFAVEGDGQPRVVGVMSGYEEEFSFWDWFIAKHTVHAAGMRMANLIQYGRTNWGI